MDQAAAEMKHGSGGAAPAQFDSAQRDALHHADGRDVRQRQLPEHAASHSAGRGLERLSTSGARNRKARGRLRGRALSSFLEWTGVVHEETIELHVEADGRVLVYTAMQAMGQGIETSYVQIIADTLDVDPDAHRHRAGRQRRRAGPRQHGQPLALHRRLGDADGIAGDDREGPPARGRRRWRWPAPTWSTSRGGSRSRGPTSASTCSSSLARQPQRRIAIVTNAEGRRRVVAEQLPRLRSRDRSGNRRHRNRALHDGRRRGPRGQSADRRRPGAWRDRAGRRAGDARGCALRRARADS